MKTYVNIPRPTIMPDHIVRRVEKGLAFVAEKRAIFEEIRNSHDLDQEKLEFEISRLDHFLNQETAKSSHGGGDPFSWLDHYKLAEELYKEMKHFQNHLNKKGN